MVGEVLKRVVNAAVAALAAVTFFLVPVGDKTPAEHLVAIFRTAPAREAAGAAAGAGRKIVTSVTEMRAPARPTAQPAATAPAATPPAEEELEPAD
jgi:pyruvate/2-oxoglutarate dehydrogenase complex dihydrolipoamide acyltransferase (E2) component